MLLSPFQNTLPHPFVVVRALHNQPYCAINTNFTASPHELGLFSLVQSTHDTTHHLRLPSLQHPSPLLQSTSNLSILLDLILPHSLYLQCREQCVRLFIYRLGSVETKLVPSSGKLTVSRKGVIADQIGRLSLRSMVSRPMVPTRVLPICSWSE